MLSAEQKNILIIGNSHSVDAFWLLSQALRDLVAGMEPVLGVAYYSGCSITRHIEFGTANEPAYRYYKNMDGAWDVRKEMTLDAMLRDEPWDVVFLQAAKSDLDETLNQTGRRTLEAFVNERVGNPHRFFWHTSWPSPNDEHFFAPEHKPQPPKGYKDRLINLYGFDPVNQFTVLTDKAKAHILTDSTYPKAVCTGAAILNAHLTQGCPQREIWRDYTHLRDFGRLIAAYAMAAQLTGRAVETVGMDVLPTALRHERFQELGDMEITPEMKQIVIRAANHALEDPWSVPDV